MDSSAYAALAARVVVRAARATDVDAVAQVHVESTEDAYAPLARSWPAVDMEQRRAHWREWIADGLKSDARRVSVVAELAGSVVGFCSGGPARERAHGGELELYVIHVLPSRRAAGIGALLWSDACRQLRGVDLRSMYVSTLAELRCCSFYERRGGVAVSRRPRSFHGAERTEVIYLWAAGRSSLPEAVPAGDLQPNSAFVAD